MGFAPFVHLRNHTAYSLAEGALRIPSLANLCKKYQMGAVAITDTNNLFGGAEFSSYIPDAGIKPIIGTQVSVDFNLPSSIDAKNKYSELVLLVKNEEGYKNILKLLSYGFLKKESIEPPHVTFDMLKEKSNGLIVLSGGTKGVIGKSILANDLKLAEEKCLELKEIFKDDFYIEIQRHGSASEIETEDEFLNLAYKHNIPIVATNECFFETKDMYQAHDILICIANGNFVDEVERRYETPEHYFKSPDEMIELFSDIPEAIQNTIQIATKCNYTLKKSKALLPHIEKGVDEDELLRNKSFAGLMERLASLNISGDEQIEYITRLNYELETIINMGFPGYFLIVADFIGWAKEHGIPVGPGRGSGAGSIVAWSLKITDLNPLQFGLLFERFLNPDRVSMPDFDIDFCQDRRGEVISYIQDKYGFDSVGQIITFGKLQAKNAIKDVGRVLRVSYLKCDDLCKLIPNKLRHKDTGKDVKITIQNCLEHIPEFKQMVENDDVLKGLLNISIRLEGLYRNAGTHAAGVVIGDRPIDELTPLYKDDKSDMPVTQYNMKYIEDTGLIKYDFLGLKTLTVIKKTCDMLLKTRGIKINIDNIPIDDKKTYDMIATSNTTGVFQLESRGMQNVILEMKPDKIEDLIALVSLYRPGPMDSIPSYVSRKFGAKIEYLHPLMEPILRETYGIMVYQEQVMEMGRVLAGYTLGGADLLRRAMGKKIKEEMAKQRQIFKEGCLKVNNIDETTSMKIFDLMEKFADYGFNKSHAACYAWISYQTAYLKTHFAPEFFAASMTYDMGDTDKLLILSEDAKKLGIKILRPDINKSAEYFSVENSNIRYSMAAIKGVGVGVVEAIKEERNKNGEFKNITDFISRIDPKNVNKRTLENMIKAGVFDELEPNRNKLFENVSYILSYISSINKDKETNQTSLFSIDEMETKRDDIRLQEAIDFKPLEKLSFEKDVIGFYVSAHPLDVYENTLKILKAVSSTELSLIKEDGKVTVAGVVENAKLRTSKNGKDYILARISDKEGSFDVMFFKREPSSYNQRFSNRAPVQDFEEIQKILNNQKPVSINADAKPGDGRVSLFGSRVENLNINLESAQKMFIKVENKDSVRALKKTLTHLPPGYTSIDLEIVDDTTKIIVNIPGKYAITSETLELFKVIPDITYHF